MTGAHYTPAVNRLDTTIADTLLSRLFADLVKLTNSGFGAVGYIRLSELDQVGRR